MERKQSSRASSPTPSTFSGIFNYRTESYCPVKDQRSMSVMPSLDPKAIFRTHYDELQQYLVAYLARSPANSRSAARQKLTRLTQYQFQELSTDVYDELIRRKTTPENDIPCLPPHDEFHPKRNQARRKLATLRTARFEDLSSDVHFELSRRYPEFKEENETGVAPVGPPGSPYDDRPSPEYHVVPRLDAPTRRPGSRVACISGERGIDSGHGSLPIGRRLSEDGFARQQQGDDEAPPRQSEGAYRSHINPHGLDSRKKLSQDIPIPDLVCQRRASTSVRRDSTSTTNAQSATVMNGTIFPNKSTIPEDIVVPYGRKRNKSLRPPSPMPTASSGISNYRTGSLRSVKSQGSMPAMPSLDPKAIFRTHYNELQRYLVAYLAKPPANSRWTVRQKLIQLTQQELQELSTDVYDELIRRRMNTPENEIPCLPPRDEFHPGRNQARQKLATLPTAGFEDLSSDIHFELSRRYPEFKEENEAGATDNVPPQGTITANIYPHTTPLVPGPQQSMSQIRPSSVPGAAKVVPNGQVAAPLTDLSNQITRDGHDPVASGGFADIYRGMLQENGEFTKVAIKAIKMYSGEDGNFAKKQKRLRREIRVWLDLIHVNVMPLLGMTTGFGRFPAMVCPWAENGTLTSYLEDRYYTLSVVEILGLLNNVASGLQYLHSRSVMHGDLSGSNILICRNGRACIADFGLSMLLTELGASTFATSFHARGTLRWTAPEMLDLEVPEDGMEEELARVAPTTQSDVYSFGSIMLQILSGKVPYHYYARDAQVIHAVSKGITPRRPSIALITERRWMFIERCWSANEVRSRPSSEEIVEFTGKELSGASAL